jgi:hypothetical protein
VLVLLSGAAILSLFQHPQPNHGGSPAPAKYQYGYAAMSAVREHQNENDEKGNNKGYWIEQLFEKPTDFLLVIFNGILAIFTALLYRATAGLFKETRGLRTAADQQALDMKESLSLAKETFISNNRAWIKANVSLSSIGMSMGERILDISINIGFQNVGDSTAIAVDHIAWVDFDEERCIKHIEEKMSTFRTIAPYVGLTVFPKDEIGHDNFVCTSEDSPDDNPERMSAFWHIVYIGGFVLYTFSADDEKYHFTPFMYSVQRIDHLQIPSTPPHRIKASDLIMRRPGRVIYIPPAD